jgi:glycosyltransferase involved in cell wall biosynthesis
MKRVTIGIATFNRPHILELALESASKQTCDDMRIIVSDNASPGEETREVVRRFQEKDSRIQYHRQSSNLGATGNFLWLLENSESDFFMWLADDDELKECDHISEQLRLFDDRTKMVFPDVDEILNLDRNKFRSSILRERFAGCDSDFSYLLAWCAFGGGHPFYGLFKTHYLKELIAENFLRESWSYFNEGIFLHNVFMRGGVKFCPTSTLKYNVINSSTKVRSRRLLKDFLRYSLEVHLLHATSSYSLSEKARILKLVRDSHVPYIRHLARKSWNDEIGG